MLTKQTHGLWKKAREQLGYSWYQEPYCLGTLIPVHECMVLGVLHFSRCPLSPGVLIGTNGVVNKIQVVFSNQISVQGR